jgi:hypothetical protein
LEQEEKVSDGREEREERENRRAQDERKDRRDEMEQHPVDQWKPERTDS